MARIVIVSAQSDAHLPFVEKHLTNDEVIRIDPIDIIKGSTLDYAFQGGVMQVIYRGEVLNDITSVWYRRPTPVVKEDIPVRDSEKAYALDSIERHIRAFAHLLPDALWMSDVTALRRANSKPLQLATAHTLGFNVPRTLFTSDSKQAKNFVDQEGQCIVKSQAPIFPQHKVLLAKLVNAADDLDYRGLQVDPYIFQQFIDPVAELRVTVVHDQVFTAQITAASVDGRVSDFRDWRFGHWNDTFAASPYTLPKQLSEKCVRLVKYLGLEFGAIDIILDKKGVYWFLEINPNGQWAFVEEVTGQPIGEAIAARLRGNHRLHRKIGGDIER